MTGLGTFAGVGHERLVGIGDRKHRRQHRRADDHHHPADRDPSHDSELLVRGLLDLNRSARGRRLENERLHAGLDGLRALFEGAYCGGVSRGLWHGESVGRRRCRGCDVRQGKHRNVALQRDVLTPHDRVLDEEAHAVDVEDDFDDDRPADQRADVEAGDGQQGEAGGPERVPPQDPGRAQALGPRHRDEVLLQRGDHVAAKEAHVDGDLPGRQADDGQQRLSEVVDGVVAEVDPTGRFDAEPSPFGADVVGEHQRENEVGYRE